MTRLDTYEREKLTALSVTGTGGLRDILRAEHAAANFTQEELAAHGINPTRFGAWVGACDKAGAIALIMGEAPEVPFPLSPAAMKPIPTAPAAVAAIATAPAGADAGMAAMAAMLAPYLPGRGDAEGEVKAALDKMIAPALTDISNKAEILNAAFSKVGKEFREDCINSLGKAEAGFETLTQKLLERRPVEITIVKPEGERKTLARQHYLFPLVMAVASTRSHAYLVGPAGSGKTSLCHSVSKALGLEFRAISVCQQSTKTDLLGYMDAMGVYRTTAFREMYEKGGVFVLDEIDNGNPNVIAVLNSALANDGMDFADARVSRHPDFVLLACGNTYGQGADRQYVGRNQLDAATLDRFCFIDFPYDEGLEMEICGVKGIGSPHFDIGFGGAVTADKWVAYCQSVRAAIEETKQRHIVSPRASIYGCKLSAAGVGRARLEEMLLWKGLDETAKGKIKASIK